MDRAFSPHIVFGFVSWGDAPGWNKAAPLALPFRTLESTAPPRSVNAMELLQEESIIQGSFLRKMGLG